MKNFPSNILIEIGKKTQNINPILFYGNESGLIIELIKSIYSSLQKKLDLSEIIYFDYKNNNDDELEEILKSSSLFSKINFIVIKNPQERLVKQLENIDKQVIKKSLDLSMYWAERSKNAFGINPTKALFGIIQGGLFEDLRIKSLKHLLKIEFDGYALGGLAVGESQGEMFKIIDSLKKYIPKDKPRYLMGVGTPSDIIGAVKRGIDMFDCVIPTRSGRTGLAFTWEGRLNLRNSKYKNDDTPINENISIRNLNAYSKSYINHLINSNEILASMILTMNNIIFYQELMKKIRIAIKTNTFNVFYNKYINVI